MADATDLFRKGKSNFATTLAGGISDSDTTIPLSSAVGLPTDTAVTLTIDRVDANGKSTPGDVERVTGVVSGTNLVDCLRGEDGTTPSAHEAGAVVEMIWDGETWNDAVGGILAEHNQDGTHKITTFQHLYAPEGFLLNGKIVPSVASNNLTVAIKGMDGNDPSATNPVYVRISDGLRSITSSLSLTINTGFNWFNAGSSELTGKEVDYFVYLTWDVTASAVRLAVSRMPYFRKISERDASGVDKEKFMIFSTNPTSNDDHCVVVGRFAATLTAGSGYTWSVPTFTPINLIQRPIYETRVLSYAVTQVGWSGTPTVEFATYYISGNSVSVHLGISGTATTGGCSVSLPISMKHYRYAYGFSGSYSTGGTHIGLSIGNNSTATANILVLKYDGGAVPTSGSFTVGIGGEYPIS